MKLKENKGMSLIVFTIILAVLVVVAGGVIVYLLNQPEVENEGKENSTIIQNDIINNNVENTTDENKITDKNTTDKNETDNKNNTKYSNLSLNSKEVMELTKKLWFEGATATLYNRGDFNLNTISNDLILKLGWSQTAIEDNESLTNSLGIATLSATKEDLKASIQKIFGKNIKYKDASFTSTDSTIYAISEKVTYDKNIYRVDSTGGSGKPRIYQEIQEVRKYSDRIEVVVKTAFTDYNAVDPSDGKLVIYKDIKNGKLQNKVMEISKGSVATPIIDGMERAVFAIGTNPDLSAIYNNLNTYTYTLSLDKTTNDYYLSGFAKTKTGKTLKNPVIIEIPAEVKSAVQKYFDIRFGEADKMLEALGFTKYTTQLIEGNTDIPKRWLKTNIKYEDYKKAMLNFVSENVFDEIREDQKDGYLLIELSLEVGSEYELVRVDEGDNGETDNDYIAKIKTWVKGDSKEDASEQEYIFATEKLNGKYIISYADVNA